VWCCCCLEHIAGAIAELAKEHHAQGLAVVAISSNSSQPHPDMLLLLLLQVPLLSWRKSTRPGGWQWWPSAATAATLTLTCCCCCCRCCIECVAGAIAELAKEYQSRGLAAVAISSNSNHTHSDMLLLLLLLQVPLLSWQRSTRPGVWQWWPSAATAARHTRRTGLRRWQRTPKQTVGQGNCDAGARPDVVHVVGCVWRPAATAAGREDNGEASQGSCCWVCSFDQLWGFVGDDGSRKAVM
jgi:peroxiredoxin